MTDCSDDNSIYFLDITIDKNKNDLYYKQILQTYWSIF